MFCKNCGAELDDTARFCSKCGTPASSEAMGTGTVISDDFQNSKIESPHTVSYGKNKVQYILAAFFSIAVITIGIVVIWKINFSAKFDENTMNANEERVSVIESQSDNITKDETTANDEINHPVTYTGNASSQSVKIYPADGEVDYSISFDVTGNNDRVIMSTDFYSISIPGDWAQYCLYDYEDMSGVEYRLTFYEKQSYYDGYGGNLFSIVLIPQYENYDAPEATILSTLNIPGYGGYHIISQYPSDVQFSEAGMSRYTSLGEDIRDILDSFQPLNGTSILTEQEENYDYWFDTSYIDEASLSDVSRDDIMWSRNEIYARHGYIFQNKDIQAAFESTDWYVPNPNYSDSLLNDIEKENLNTIIAYEKKMGWRS